MYRIVKATSPYLNMLIIVGVILIYVDTILFGIDGGIASDEVLNVTCNVRQVKMSVISYAHKCVGNIPSTSFYC